jgi:hypothetical protein
VRLLLIPVALCLALASFLAFNVAPAPSRTSVAACGVERWSVKTLSDSRARLVRRRRSTTVNALRRLRPPANSSGRRVAPVETTIWTVHASLLATKVESDEDIHLVIAQPHHLAHTMIVEFPATDCTVGASPRHRAQMRAARAAFVAACGQPSDSSFDNLRGTATISGVGFFDFDHGQDGVAPNAIELHPVLSFHARSCRSS